MQQSVIAVPSWGLTGISVIFLTFCFVLGIVMATRLMSSRGSSSTAWLAVLLCIPAMIFVFLLVGWASFSVRSREFQTATVTYPPNPPMAVHVEAERLPIVVGESGVPRTITRISPDSPAKPADGSRATAGVTDVPATPTPLPPPVAPKVFSPATPVVPPPIVRAWHINPTPLEVLFVVILGGILLSRFVSLREPRPLVQSTYPAKGPRHYWLVVPAVCLAVLIHLGYSKLIPTIDLESVRLAQQLSVRQLKMDKIVRDLMADASKPDAEVKNIPDWLKNFQPTPDHVLLTSEQYSSREEAENDVLPYASYLLQRAFQERHPWQGTWTVPVGQIRERVIEHQFVEHRTGTTGKNSYEIYRVHMLANVSPRVTETFTEEWKSQIVQHRLEVLGIIFGWITCVFLLSAYHFRRAIHPENTIGLVSNFMMGGTTIGLTGAATWLLRRMVM